MWSQTKKRPTSVLRRAHGYPHPGLGPVNEHVTNGVNGQAAAAEESDPSSTAADAEPVGAGSVGGDAASWIGAVGVCKGTDLVVGCVFVALALNAPEMATAQSMRRHLPSASVTCLLL